MAPQKGVMQANAMKPKPTAASMAKRSPRRFDPEDNRQRRYGAASGAALTGGALSAHRGLRGPNGMLKEVAETKTIPLNRRTGRVGASLGLVAVGAHLWNRGSEATNRRYR
jgi:hypothetical protein